MLPTVRLLLTFSLSMVLCLIPQQQAPLDVNISPKLTHSASNSTYNSGTSSAHYVFGQVQHQMKLQASYPDARPVRGIYVSGWVAGSANGLNRMLNIARNNDLNAMVIDVKNDFGKVTYASSLPEVKEIDSDSEPLIKDVDQMITTLKEQNIYLIGRVVVFRDPWLVHNKPQWAIYKKSGALWRDKKGTTWIDPYQQEVWDYNIAIAKEAAAKGFNEIQFDYVRFPENGAKMDQVVQYANSEQLTKSQAISRFLEKARSRIHEDGAKVSADVFGLVTSSSDDMGIGQTWSGVSRHVDTISPMTYPSHYSQGMYGIANPDLEPYAVINRALTDAGRRNEQLVKHGIHAARVRPWLQGFTASWIHPHQNYTSAQIKAQIQAAEDLGIQEFLIWDAQCRYDYEI